MSNKLIRINLLKDIIKRWGPLDKGQIDTHLSNQLNQELDSALKRAIYRDLEKLVELNEIKTHYFDKDDCEIDFEQIGPKIFYRNKWSSEETKKIQGEGILQELGCSIKSSDILIDEIAIFNNRPHIKSNEIIILITTLASPLYIKIKKDLAPIKVIISRKFEFRSDEIRAINISINDRTISAPHLEIIVNANSFNINDLQSKNGSSYYELKAEELEKTLKLLDQRVTTTAQTNKKYIPFKKLVEITLTELKVGISTNLIIY